MTTRPQNALIRFEGDAYDVSRSKLMGRQSAGVGFFRAAVAARGDGPVGAYGPDPNAQAAFVREVAALDPAAQTEWRLAHEFDAFSRWGILSLPYLFLGADARLRQRAGPARYSLCGITHTTSTQRSMDQLAAMLSDPLEPWDAVICTSNAVLETVRRVHEVEADYLKWRFGPETRIAGPHLPVIPLGVHCDDFNFTPADRRAARQALKIGPDEIVVLFVGRFSIVTKAHPLPMYQASQAAAERTGQAVTLLHAGWEAYPGAQAEFESGATQWAPSVRSLFVDGREGLARDAWAAADIFVSLADNIQETFGLTPVEAMAAGIPAVVSDWNGYKETVRDGVDGFRITTRAPQPGVGDFFALAAEAQLLSYEQYLLRAASATSIDVRELSDRLTSLVGDPDLRRAMGESGRAHAHTTFDWAGIYHQYQELWAELTARRVAVRDDQVELARVAAAPKITSARQDAFRLFGHYPSTLITPQTGVSIAPDSTLDSALAIIGHPLTKQPHANAQLTELLWPALVEQSSITIEALAQRAGCRVDATLLAVANLAKMGVVTCRGESEHF